MPKPNNLSIGFRLPKDSKVVKASITPDGEILFTDDAGNIITPEYMERAVHYDRFKGPKIQARNKTTAGYVSIGGLQELAQFDSVFVMDTNRKTISNKEIAAACFVCCRFIPEGKQFRIECDGKINVYEFHNVPANENPEMLAVLKVAVDITSSVGSSNPPRIAFVSDSELGLHDKINAGQVPIYGSYHLPLGFVLHYASADTGQEAINRMIKFCDKQSSNYLRYLEEGSVKVTELNALKEDPSVQYRYMFREDLEVVNPIVGGIAIQPGTGFTLYGVEEPHTPGSS